MHTLRPTFVHVACDAHVPSVLSPTYHVFDMCGFVTNFDPDVFPRVSVIPLMPSFDDHRMDCTACRSLPSSSCGLKFFVVTELDVCAPGATIGVKEGQMDFSQVTAPLPQPYLDYMQANSIETIDDWVQWYSNRLANVHQTLEALNLSPGEDLCVLTCFTAAMEEYQRSLAERAGVVLMAATSRPKSVPVKARPPLCPLQPTPKPGFHRLRPGEVHQTTLNEVVTETAVGEDPAKAKREKAKQDALDRMWGLAMSVPGIADHFGVDVNLPRSNYMALLKGPSELSLERLRCLNSGLQRFLDWCAAQEPPVRPFTARVIDLASYFARVSLGGPTAAVSAYYVLDFWMQKFGMKLYLDDPLLNPWSVAMKGHRVLPAEELEPWEFYNMCVIIGREVGSLRLLYNMELLATCSCIRFRHLQRSSLCSPDGVFTCAEGKTKTGGHRAPYDWVMGCPPEMAGGQGALNSLIHFWDQDMPSTTFLLPSFRADRQTGVTSDIPLVLNRPMNSSRFMELLRGLLLRCGCSMERVRGVKYNTLRRFLPTAANCFAFSPEDQQAIGSWQEIPGGGLQSSSQKPTADGRTSLRYSGAKLERSLTAKNNAIRLVVATTRAVASQYPFQYQDGLLPANSVTWRRIAEYRRANSQLDHRPSKLLKVSEMEEEASDSEHGSKSSSVQTEDLDLPYVAGEAIVQQLQYFRQGSAHSGKFHIVCTLGEYDSRPTPWCRNTPFPQDALGGVHDDLRGISDPTRVCTRCLHRMPMAEKEVVRLFLFPEEMV